MTKDDNTGHWPHPRGFSLRDRELVESLWDDARTARLLDLYYGGWVAALTKATAQPTPLGLSH